MAKKFPRNPTKPLITRAAFYDASVRGLLSAFFALSAGVYFRNAIHTWRDVIETGFTMAGFVHGLSNIAVTCYVLMIACLYILRRKPVNKFAGIWPSIAALLGGFLIMALVLLEPRNDLPLDVQILGSALLLVGNGMAIYILTHLGRSFSILPEGRRLVTSGPYKYVRHPLYVAEVFAVLGAMVAFWSPAAILIVIAQLAFQLVRIHYEERVLTRTFPEYKNYARRTSRLIPGVY
jgi:protein-S-isoprenylcysteine O-methyltransferase Ste14